MNMQELLLQSKAAKRAGIDQGGYAVIPGIQWKAYTAYGLNTIWFLRADNELSSNPMQNGHLMVSMADLHRLNWQPLSPEQDPVFKRCFALDRRIHL